MATIKWWVFWYGRTVVATVVDFVFFLNLVCEGDEYGEDRRGGESDWGREEPAGRDGLEAIGKNLF